MGLIGEAMGQSRAELYKRMVLYQDLEQVMSEAAPYMAANGANQEMVHLQQPGALWTYTPTATRSATRARTRGMSSRPYATASGSGS
jgi:hypothetical protein